ncbi:MAG: glycosyltransferase family 2 protein [Actinomycetota bacterium]|nr:glycosyltransferase family 2 protein [Actinomycetota bacterium]
MRDFQKEWEIAHRDMYTSTPFAGIEGLGISSRYLNEAIAGIEIYSQRDVAWSISKTMSDNGIVIRIDDSNYLHSSSPCKYQVSISYRKSSRDSFFYDKVAIDLSDRFGEVTAAVADGATSVLSLAMIVKNEVKNLAKCIESVRGIVEEVIVVDTGSSDGTIELLERLGISPVRFDWIDDFGAARDFALNSSNSDWVLHLDADEVFEADRKEFVDELSSWVEKCVAVFVNIFNHDSLNIAEAFSHQMSRVVRRVDTCWYGMIHEQVFDRTGRRPPIATPLISGHIDHYGYSNVGDVMQKKAERNLKIAKKYHETVNDLFSAINLARSYLFAGDSGRAEELLEKTLLGVGLEPSLPIIYRLLIELKLGRNDLDAARRYVVEFGSRFPRRADQISREAMVLAKSGDVEGALAVYRSLPSSESYLGDISFRKSQAAVILGGYFGEHGRYFEACEIILGAMDGGSGLEVHPSMLIDYLEKAQIDPYEYYRRIPKNRLISTFGLIRQMQFNNPDLATRFIISLLKSGVQDLIALVAVAETSKCAHLSLRLEVSAILRAKSMDEFCPLITSAQLEMLPLAERLSSLYVAQGAFRDYRASAIFLRLISEYEGSELVKAVELANKKYQLEVPSSADELIRVFESQVLEKS